MNPRDGDVRDPGNGYERTKFDRIYRCYSASSFNKHDLESGNQILMPASALDTLLSMELTFPMVFEIKGFITERTSHCGVKEFSAEEGTVILPHLMLQNLSLQEGEVVVLTNVNLPKGTFMKLQPHETKFLDIPDPAKTLEFALKSYACATTGDTIMITHEDEVHYIDILESKPYRAIRLTETDCNIDFAPPLDYKEPEKPAVSTLGRKLPVDKRPLFDTFMAMGAGMRLDGKPSTVSFSATTDHGNAQEEMEHLPSPPKKAKTSHPPGGLLFRSSMQDTHKQPERPAPPKMQSNTPALQKHDIRRFMAMGDGKRLDGKPSTVSFTYASEHANGSNGEDMDADMDDESDRPTAPTTPSNEPVIPQSMFSKIKGMGIGKRLDGKPSQISFPSISFGDEMGLASDIPAAPQSKASHPPGKPASESGRRDAHNVTISQQQPQKVETAQFIPFTGRKYRLDD